MTAHTALIEVTQADRDAAASVAEAIWGKSDGDFYRNGKGDDLRGALYGLPQAFARHRAAAAARIEALSAQVAGLEDRATRLNRKVNDAEYMKAALVAMLGPNGIAVWQSWQRNRVERVHFDWGPEAHTLTGEERAAIMLEWEEAVKDAKPIEDIDGPDEPQEVTEFLARAALTESTPHAD